MATILVLGSSGLLGTSLVPWLRTEGHSVIAQSRSEYADLRLDTLNGDELTTAMELRRPDFVINLAAATNVDQCETAPVAAFLANTRIVETIVQAMGRLDPSRRPHLVHLSTDQVYDGEGPHSEDTARPSNVYALTKYAGELAALNVDSTVLRTNFVGRSACRNRVSLSDWIVTSLRSDQRITVFEDVQFSPMHISSLCAFVCQVLAAPAPGVFNVGCSGGLSKAEFAFGLARTLGLDLRLMTRGKASSASFKAHRPSDMRLHCARAQRTFGFEPPSPEQLVHLTAQEYLHA